MKIQSVTVFCGSKSGNQYGFTNQAIELGNALAENGIQLVYGGGGKGIMGSIADAVLAKNGKVVGIMPQLLLDWEAQHQGLTELIVTETMHDRKKILFEKADVAIILPGGMGTMDELFEMLTWNNLNIHQKKVIVLNWEGYYSPLIAMMEHMHNEGFMYDDWRDRITVAKDAEAVMQTIHAWSGE
jgi:uncharacterized protein (TIGR00730 family)